MADKLDSILALLTDPVTGLSAIAAKLNVAVPAPEPPASAPVIDFVKKYTPSTDAEFEAKYGVAKKTKLSPLPQPLVPSAVSEYAKEGYNYQGSYCGGPMIVLPEGTPEKEAARALSIIAKGDPHYYTGSGLVDSNVSYVGLMGIFASEGCYRAWKSSSSQWPVTYQGMDFPTFVSNMVGGQAGGGG
jgi:hypothetical protein